jgi:hypothetical protein
MPGERTNVIFPHEVLKELRKLVPKRQRSRFIVESTKEHLSRLRFQRAAQEAAGAWKADDHPELRTLEDVHRFLSKIQKKDKKRLERIRP